MPNHYDIDYHCPGCGKYLFSQSGYDFKLVKEKDRFCVKCWDESEGDADEHGVHRGEDRQDPCGRGKRPTKVYES